MTLIATSLPIVAMSVIIIDLSVVLINVSDLMATSATLVAMLVTQIARMCPFPSMGLPRILLHHDTEIPLWCTTTHLGLVLRLDSELPPSLDLGLEEGFGEVGDSQP